MSEALDLVMQVAQSAAPYVLPAGGGLLLWRSRFVRSLTKLIGARLHYRLLKREGVPEHERHRFLVDAARDAQDLPAVLVDVVDEPPEAPAPDLRVLPSG